MSLNRDQMKEVANTIYQQLGGNKFKVMTGAKDFVYQNEQSNGGLSFKLPRMSGVKVNYVKIVLNVMDLYDVEFGKISKNDYKVLSSFNDVYCDQLRELFEDQTGLRTSL